MRPPCRSRPTSTGIPRRTAAPPRGTTARRPARPPARAAVAVEQVAQYVGGRPPMRPVEPHHGPGVVLRARDDSLRGDGLREARSTTEPTMTMLPGRSRPARLGEHRLSHAPKRVSACRASGKPPPSAHGVSSHRGLPRYKGRGLPAAPDLPPHRETAKHDHDGISSFFTPASDRPAGRAPLELWQRCAQP